MQTQTYLLYSSPILHMKPNVSNLVDLTLYRCLLFVDNYNLFGERLERGAYTSGKSMKIIWGEGDIFYLYVN